MDDLTVHIVSSPVYAYRLTGKDKDLVTYHERALEDARDLYLNLYDRVYQDLMATDFHPLWTPDTQSVNDLDFKDDFWKVSYYYFNVCLLNLISNDYRITVVDQTSFRFPAQKYLYKFLKDRGMELRKLHKPDRLFTKNALKKGILGTMRGVIKLPGLIGMGFRKRWLLNEQPTANINAGKKTLYLFVEPVGTMRFVSWRYSSLLNKYRKMGANIVLVSTTDFEESEKQEYPFVNVHRWVSKTKLIKTSVKALLLKLRVGCYRLSKLFRPGVKPEFEYFLNNLPMSFFYPLRENEGFDQLFRTWGPGLLVIKGPMINKGGGLQIHNARKHGVRVLILAGRILTPTRLSNQFVQSHFDERYPKILPHSMVVYDRISYETIRRQTDEITLYTAGMDDSPEEEMEEGEVAPSQNPFRMTLVLQKKKEIEEMVDEVIMAVKGLDDMVVNCKMHPLFPMPDRLKQKYGRIPYLNILPVHLSLEAAVKDSDICLTSYSSAAFDFVKKGKPVVWLKHVTFNSLFFAEVQKKIGISVHNSDELREYILKLKENFDYYDQQRSLHRAQLNRLVYHPNGTTACRLPEIIDRELNKV